MYGRIGRLLREERGITALETAIILIAFVVVASVFAFTILSAGTFSTEKSKEAVYAGLAEVQGTMQLKGSVLAGSPNLTTTEYITFTVASALGGEPVDLTANAATGTAHVVSIDFRNTVTQSRDLFWTTSWLIGTGPILDPGEMAEIRVNLTVTGADACKIYSVGANSKFALEIKPPVGAIIVLERTMPPALAVVMDLK